MAESILIPPSVLRQILAYEPGTGRFFWNRRPLAMFTSQRMANAWNSRFAGKEAFTLTNDQGYKRGGIFCATYRAHRIAWVMVHDRWPIGEIDHINGNRADNRIANLREATRTQNNMNSGLRSDNTSGFRGVYFNKQRGAWHARVHVGKRALHVGFFADPEEAHRVYARESKRIHGEFVRD